MIIYVKAKTTKKCTEKSVSVSNAYSNRPMNYIVRQQEVKTYFQGRGVSENTHIQKEKRAKRKKCGRLNLQFFFDLSLIFIKTSLFSPFSKPINLNLNGQYFYFWERSVLAKLVTYRRLDDMSYTSRNLPRLLKQSVSLKNTLISNLFQTSKNTNITSKTDSSVGRSRVFMKLEFDDERTQQLGN